MANRVYGYQGYQYETSPKKLQPEYKPNKKESYGYKKNIKAKKVAEQKAEERKRLTAAQAKKRAIFVSYIIFGFAILFTISYRNSIINEKFTKKESYKSNLSEIKKSNEQLKVALENDLNLTSIEQMAKEKIGMNKLDNNQKVYVTLPKKEYTESKKALTVRQENKNVFQKAGDAVKSFFHIK